MRIRENFHDGCELYTEELRKRTADIFRQAFQITEMKRLLAEIRKQSVLLREVFLTEEEMEEEQKTADDFDAKMRGTVSFTLNNLETYQQSAWKELIYKGDVGHE
ncbi:hypothetical protein ACRQV7_12470 [Caproiciproducens sp. R2]|uniref:hypothetical protein n=1 Tax=Caproiciproducens sp. R2 TaxID=3435187 RepID=UPI004034E120